MEPDGRPPPKLTLAPFPGISALCTPLAAEERTMVLQVLQTPVLVDSFLSELPASLPAHPVPFATAPSPVPVSHISSLSSGSSSAGVPSSSSLKAIFLPPPPPLNPLCILAALFPERISAFSRPFVLAAPFREQNRAFSRLLVLAAPL